MKERAVLVGKKRSLVGVLTEPSDMVSARNRPAIVLLNAGLMHRVGPHRIYVQIARQLAASGFCAFRFDLAGIGDSANRTDDLSLQDGIISDVKEAMDFLGQDRGIRQFILAGICSGANNSLLVAQSDMRVIGAVPIEAYYFATPAYHWYFYRRRLLNPRSWRRLVTLRSDFWGILRKYQIRKAKPAVVTGRSEQFGAKGRESFKTRIVPEIENLLNRGVHLHFIYCVDSPSYYNHYLSIRDKAASWKQLRTSVFANTDHTFTLLANQEALVQSIDEWVKSVLEPFSLHRGWQKTPVQLSQGTLFE
jgi:hypothetical protein